jgi:hypothetical protein
MGTTTLPEKSQQRTNSSTNSTTILWFQGYNCREAVHQDIVQLNDFKVCLFPASKLLENTRSFQAEVRKKNEEVTGFKIVNCHLFTAKLTCKETFWWQKKKTAKVKSQPLTRQLCIEMFQRIWTNSSDWERTGENSYNKKTHDAYRCKWDQTRTNSFIHETVNIYTAYVKGKDRKI